jgi:hypothetical protein
VTVAGPRLRVSAALATAAFADQATDLSRLDRYPGYEVLVMTSDGWVRWTPGWDEAVSR